VPTGFVLTTVKSFFGSRGVAAEDVKMSGFEMFGAEEIASKLIAAAASKQYRDSPALAAVKLLQAAGLVALA
jgi:hypothetical protein